ncbi:type 3 dihydrofolate reductase [Kordiimonas sp. SCSIO 12603]|uniref:type 3 dihydrofolate reductase n=1 Tax=Kordiimonas sp. SCSIO 12603 TaxID=2829596 RepID=UPI002105B09D|nr:type 3 dihydrofolate reductase [Kordiimonas sp. SCSIO 12603]UTW57885.1 type 3 dihydrofolate reductase [Kordiimonas sp. SCSIO 12603]
MISIIVAMGENRVIGVDNDLPWHLPEDLKYFKKTTLGKPIIMGRKTFESIGRPLPGRQNIVITRNTDWATEGVDVVSTIEDAIKTAGDVEEVMITGGAQIYAASMDLCDRLYVTEVGLAPEGHAYFPEIDEDRWKAVSREDHGAQDGKPSYAFVVYERA